MAQQEQIKWLLNLREWELRNLPIRRSVMAYEIYLRLALLSGNGGPLHGVSLKRFYLSLGCSEYGARMHLRRLERDGWIRFVEGDGDRRGRQVVLTEKFEALRRSHLQILSDLRQEPRPARL